MYNMMKEVIAPMEVENKAEMLAFIEKEIGLLERKSSKSTPTKTQKENEVLKAEILAEFEQINRPVTVSEFQSLTRFAPPEFSNQKISAMLNQLAKTGKVVKTTEKKKSYFSVV